MGYGGFLHEFFRACGFCHIHDSPCLEEAEILRLIGFKYDPLRETGPQQPVAAFAPITCVQVNSMDRYQFGKAADI